MEIARKRGGVAGDVDDVLRSEAGDELAGLDAGAGAWWVEDDEFGAVTLGSSFAEEFERGGFDGGVLFAEFGKSVAEVGRARRGRRR